MASALSGAAASFARAACQNLAASAGLAFDAGLAGVAPSATAPIAAAATNATKPKLNRRKKKQAMIALRAKFAKENLRGQSTRYPLQQAQLEAICNTP